MINYVGCKIGACDKISFDQISGCMSNDQEGKTSILS